MGKKKIEEKSVILTLKERKDELIIQSSAGKTFELPNNITKEAAVSMLVYDTLFYYLDLTEHQTDTFEISLTIKKS